MTNNYSVVQTVEDGETLLSVLPSKWTVLNGAGNATDLGYWPVSNRGFRLLEKAKKNPDTPVDIQLLRAIHCKIKRSEFVNFTEANHLALEEMEYTSETDKYEDRKPNVNGTNAAKLFAQIQAQHESVDLSETSAMDISGVEPISQLESFAANNSTSIEFLQEINPPAGPEATTNILTLDVFNNAMNGVFGELKEVREENSILKTLLCQLNAKIDFIGSAVPSQAAVRDTGVKLKKAPFMTPFMTTKHDRENSITKIAFQKFERVLNLFYQIVSFSDPIFPQEKCDSFLHYCLKNSKQRLEHKRTNKSSARKKVKLSDGASKDDNSDDDGTEDEAEQQEVVYVAYIDKTQ